MAVLSCPTAWRCRLSWTVALSCLAAAVVAVVAYVYFQLRVADVHDRLAVEQAHHVQIQTDALSADLRFVAYFLTFIRATSSRICFH